MEGIEVTRSLLPIYMVVHYGAEDKDLTPFFLTTSGSFTTNENSQYIMKFDSPMEAENWRRIMNERLGQVGHVLKGKLHVVRLGLVQMNVKLEED